MLAGYALGWLVNAAISKWALGWPAEKIRAVYLQSDVPSHWLKDGTLGSGAPAIEESMKKWEEQRRIGAARFILVRGVLSWGGPMFFALYAAPTLADQGRFTLDGLLFNLVLWASSGAAFGALIWYTSEKNYRKLKARQ